VNADRLQGRGHGGTDVGQIGEPLEPFSLAAKWVQGKGLRRRQGAAEKPVGRATGLPGRGLWGRSC
jgi:hypothetical protein